MENEILQLLELYLRPTHRNSKYIKLLKLLNGLIEYVFD